MSFKVKDHYFKKAKKENYLARSIYKLEEIDNKYKVIPAGSRVLDLGYHPGSWIQYTAKKVGPDGQVVGIDIKHVNKKLLGLRNVKVFEKDIFDVTSVEDLGESDQFDVVVSDMAPNMSGNTSVDQAGSMYLVELALDMCHQVLKKNGAFCVKVFQGEGFDQYLQEVRNSFKAVKIRKPDASRARSREVYIVATGYKL